MTKDALRTESPPRRGSAGEDAGARAHPRQPARPGPRGRLGPPAVQSRGADPRKPNFARPRENRDLRAIAAPPYQQHGGARRRRGTWPAPDSPTHTQAAKKLGFYYQAASSFRRRRREQHGLALMSQVSSNQVAERYADDIEKDGVTPTTKGRVRRARRRHQAAATRSSRNWARRSPARASCSTAASWGATTDLRQHGPVHRIRRHGAERPSARMLADAAQKYAERHPEKKAIIENAAGARALSLPRRRGGGRS